LKCKYRDHALFTIHANSSTTQCGIGVVKKGELIVHRDRADEVLEIFRELLVARFPIQQIRFIDDFGGDDNASMSDNNSSALCVRPVTGTSNRWSQHSYGTAIDINPLVNPYVKGTTILPEAGRAFTDRMGSDVPGMIRPGDACHSAFTKRGWTWGGDWSSLKDYQHFEKPLVQSGK